MLATPIPCMEVDLGAGRAVRVRFVHPDTSGVFPHYALPQRDTYAVHMEAGCHYLPLLEQRCEEGPHASLAVLLAVDGAVQPCAVVLLGTTPAKLYYCEKKTSGATTRADFVTQQCRVASPSPSLSEPRITFHFCDVQRRAPQHAFSDAPPPRSGTVGVPSDKKRSSTLATVCGRDLGEQRVSPEWSIGACRGSLSVSILSEFGFASQHKMNVCKLPEALMPPPKRPCRDHGKVKEDDGSEQARNAGNVGSSADHPIVCD